MKAKRTTLVCGGLLAVVTCLSMTTAHAQNDYRSNMMRGSTIPANMEIMYRKGLSYLASTQQANGAWADSYGQQPGVVGIAILAFLAHGEDPNFGPYANVIRCGVSFIVAQQNDSTGMIGSSMYNHGFATLALAEAYGHVNDPKVGPALKKAIDMILKSQAQNRHNAWRYQAFGSDADTTVSGAQMVALFAAKNAGIEVPDKAIEAGLEYMASCVDGNGEVGYTRASSDDTGARTAIASLCFSLHRDNESDASKNTFKAVVRMRRRLSGSYDFYRYYYTAQALFQGDMAAWSDWNAKLYKILRGTQANDGSWSASRFGNTFGTGSALLAIALNYRLMPIYERGM